MGRIKTIQRILKLKAGNEQMRIIVKLFANLRDGREKEMTKEVNAGVTPKDMAESLGIPVDDVAIIMINGRRVEMDTIIQDGDTLALFPPVGGG